MPSWPSNFGSHTLHFRLEDKAQCRSSGDQGHAYEIDRDLGFRDDMDGNSRCQQEG